MHFSKEGNFLEKSDGSDLGGVCPVQTSRRHTSARRLTLLRCAPEALHVKIDLVVFLGHHHGLEQR